MIQGGRGARRRHRIALAGVVALLAGACAGGSGPRSAADVSNVRLSPAWAQWMVGPIAAMATQAEVQEFQALEDDAAAAAFAEAFWESHDPDPSRPGNPARELFESRAERADRQFAEAGYVGRRTARGTIFVLYGEPDAIEHEAPRTVKGEPIEVWEYDGDREVGLDGRRPQRWYRFVKQGERTVRYRGPGAPGSPTRERF